MVPITSRCYTVTLTMNELCMCGRTVCIWYVQEGSIPASCKEEQISGVRAYHLYWNLRISSSLLRYDTPLEQRETRGASDREIANKQRALLAEQTHLNPPKAKLTMTVVPRVITNKTTMSKGVVSLFGSSASKIGTKMGKTVASSTPKSFTKKTVSDLTLTPSGSGVPAGLGKPYFVDRKFIR